jgi:hypothetical protein
MNNPFVEELYYNLKLSDDISYDNPPDIIEDFGDFKLTLAKGNVVIQMSSDCSNVEQARILVEPHLRAWELDNFLKMGKMELWFEFVDSKIVDRNPPTSDGSINLYVHNIEQLQIIDEITIHVIRKNYPSPPRNILYSPDVDSMLKRYEGFLKGKEPLLSMAYFCLSLIQSKANGRKNAAHKYFLDIKVLNLMGNLTSERGDMKEARKLDKTSTLRKLTESEQNWVRETIKIFIRRIAEYEYNPTAKYPLIDLASLAVI